MSDDPKTKLVELTKGIRVAMLTTVAAGGEFVSRPMAQQDIEFTGDLWFYAENDSSAVAQIRANPHVGVTLSSSDVWVSINGEADIVTDRVKVRELWNSFAGAWLPEGPEDPKVVLIHVDGRTAEYWDTPGKVATALSFAKAKVTGERYSGGESETVQL